MAQLQGLSQGVVGKQQAIALPVLVVVIGGWESKGWNGKGTGVLTLDNSAGFFTEAVTTWSQRLLYAKLLEHQLVCELVMATSVPRECQTIWRNLPQFEYLNRESATLFLFKV